MNAIAGLRICFLKDRHTLTNAFGAESARTVNAGYSQDDDIHAVLISPGAQQRFGGNAPQRPVRFRL